MVSASSGTRPLRLPTPMGNGSTREHYPLRRACAPLPTWTSTHRCSTCCLNRRLVGRGQDRRSLLSPIFSGHFRSVCRRSFSRPHAILECLEISMLHLAFEVDTRSQTLFWSLAETDSLR